MQSQKKEQRVGAPKQPVQKFLCCGEFGKIK